MVRFKQMLPAPACRGSTLHVSLHYDGVRSILRDLKSKAFIKAQHRLACYEADRNC